jgi:plastocyanin
MEQTSGRRIAWGRRVAVTVVALGAFVAMPVASNGATFTVRATSERAWSPDSLSVAKGSKVVWKNPSDDKHTLQAYKGNWSKNATLGSGERTAFTFRHAGTYKYRCTLHSSLEAGICTGMCGKVRVH